MSLLERNKSRRLPSAAISLAAVVFFVSTNVYPAEVTVELSDAKDVTFVGAVERWDRDGNPRKPPDPNAKIDAPAVDATAVDKGGGRWVFQNLPKGTYDLVILAEGRRRFEGFQFAPVKEFDPFFTADMEVDAESRKFVVEHIERSPHYENVVEPLYLAGNEKTVRVLMMLLRDKPTSYQNVPNAATLRHEIWQYSWKHGGWQKEKRTKVMDRIIMDRNELRKRTWVWDSNLGGIEVGDRPVRVKYPLPTPSDERTLKGLYPY